MKSRFPITSLILAASSAVLYGRREEVINSAATSKQSPRLTQKREAIENAMRVIDGFQFDPVSSGQFQHDRIEEANASLFDSTNLSEPLTNYAVGWRDESGLDEALGFFAPEVPVGMRFEYRQFNNADDFENDTDDSRAIYAGFKEVIEGGTMVQDKLVNRGLMISVDEDELQGDPNWRERKVRKLLNRIKRNSLIRAVALLDAAAGNTGVTWDTTDGKDPDQDVESMLATGADGSGMMANRVAYGETARLKRKLSIRAQKHAGGFANAGMNAVDLASYLGVDQVLFARSRYGTGATKTRIMANLVLSFTAYNGADTEDASNIKRFYRMLDGQRYRVYEWRPAPKKICIAVEHYERTRITSTLGIRKLTVS